MSRLLSFRRLGRTRRLRGGVRWTDIQQTDGKNPVTRSYFFQLIFPPGPPNTKLPNCLPSACAACRLTFG